MADNLSDKIRKAKGAASKDSTYIAAARYVSNGLEKLDITRKQKIELQNKLIPIVQKTVSAERTRTATRGMGIQNRQLAKAEKAAQRKILGGK